ncbi:signal recognition particle-docking protein FtsY [Corynebacterium sp. LK2510]|uniref:signal recognition particle-docking protein FtsY n=1 Tax=Corynebacterium sp. LK2510 TaxID=3110472 RepID=UPI0034CE8808
MDAMTDVTLLLIIAAVVVVLLVLVGIIVAGNRRKKAKTVSFEKSEEPKELTQQEKSGNYQATGGFSFAPAEAQPDLVRRDTTESSARAESVAPVEPTETVEPVESVDDMVRRATDTTAAAPDDPEFEAQAATENDGDEAAVVLPPETAGEQDVEVSHEAADFAENTETPEVAEPAEANESASTLEELVEKHRAVEEEAEEAAGIAAVTAEVAEEARKDGAAVSDDAIVSHPQDGEKLDEIEPAAGRIGKLRGRLSRSQNAIGQGLLGILTAGDLDEDAWEEIEDTLIMADLGAQLTMRITDSLREKIAERGVGSEAEARAMLRETLVEAARPEMDRSIKAMPNEGKPAVILVVGVNGTGKTTTTGKLARVLVSMGHSVVLGAADTFRAAAADQLETWGRRVGASTVRGKEGADPASVAFDAVATGVDQGADVVLVDTAGRLHTATGLMDQLGKVKRVVEKKSHVDEVLLVLDATVGQNGITQARVFRDVVNITGVVLTKLDGTAKGGIVFQVQEELGVPVKLVGLGEGADDLAPFEVESFVDALLG